MKTFSSAGFKAALSLASCIMCAASLALLRARAPERTDLTEVSHLSTANPENLDAFAAIEPIDAHTHDFKSDPEFYAFLTRLHLHVLDICVADSFNIFRSLGTETIAAKQFVRGSEGHAKLCTTFDPFSFEKPGFAQHAVEQIDRDFAESAVAVKIWKNIGMQLKKSDGSYVMADDPIFQPIYEDIAAHNKTLIAHLAEPDSCWEPPNPKSPDYEYYKDNPEWYMYGKPDRPSKATILAARDRLLAKNPNLRVVGAHLGSMETDVDEVARHFDRYPNFAVDTAARMEYLMMQPREKVRQFLIKYQDRVLYGTDEEFQDTQSAADAIKEWQEAYEQDWTYLATDHMNRLRDREIQGLALPRGVVKKIFHDNAVRWIPGIVTESK